MSGTITIGGATLDAGSQVFSDTSGNPSYDWNVRRLYANEASPVISLDYEAGRLEMAPAAFDMWTVEGTADTGKEIVSYATMTGKNYLVEDTVIDVAGLSTTGSVGGASFDFRFGSAG